MNGGGGSDTNTLRRSQTYTQRLRRHVLEYLAHVRSCQDLGRLANYCACRLGFLLDLAYIEYLLAR
jgi:hypothetical protein